MKAEEPGKVHFSANPLDYGVKIVLVEFFFVDFPCFSLTDVRQLRKAKVRVECLITDVLES